MPTITEDCIDGFQQYYARPPERPKKKSFKQMIYDSDDNSYFGRTIESWGEFFGMGWDGMGEAGSVICDREYQIGLRDYRVT